jgi:hypothetical protein
VTLILSRWPFLPEEQRTPEQNERWWQKCYLPPPAEVPLRGIAHPIIISGGPGSGKSVILKALEKADSANILMFHYPIVRWPGEPHAWSSSPNHLGQMMACASMTIKDFLTRQPDKLSQLSKTNLEYLRWLIEKYNRGRAFRRWADVLNQPILLNLSEQPFDDLYPTDTDLPDIHGQIEELVTLSRRLGFEGVVILVDINETEISNEIILDKVKDLFGWLPPLQFEGFAIKATLPEKVVDQAQLHDHSRGRVNFAPLRWSPELCRELCHRHLQAASENKLKTLSDLGAEDLIISLENEITTLYGTPLPRAWLRLTTTLLGHYEKLGQKLTLTQGADLIHTYFANYVPLQFDKTRRGVWRGTHFIPLDDQPFSFLEILWQHRGGRYANEVLLKEVASSQGNLNTLANRLRRKIEPIPDKPVYLQNTRHHGYWLENVEAIVSKT